LECITFIRIPSSWSHGVKPKHKHQQTVWLVAPPEIASSTSELARFQFSFH